MRVKSLYEAAVDPNLQPNLARALFNAGYLWALEDGPAWPLLLLETPTLREPVSLTAHQMLLCLAVHLDEQLLRTALLRLLDRDVLGQPCHPELRVVAQTVRRWTEDSSVRSQGDPLANSLQRQCSAYGNEPFWQAFTQFFRDYCFLLFRDLFSDLLCNLFAAAHESSTVVVRERVIREIFKPEETKLYATFGR